MEMAEWLAEKEIDEIAGRYVSDETPGFSMLLSKDGEVLFRKAYGMADLENRRPIEPSDHFIIASNTKQFTCLAVLLLRERGLLDLDEPIARFFPDFPEYRNEVTIRMLMCHTSGIMEYFDDDFDEKLPELRTAKTGDVVRIAREYGNRLHFSPDTDISYCNTAYVMLGSMIEQLSGMRFGEFLKKEIFDVIGMEHTMAPDYMDQTDPEQVEGYSDPELQPGADSSELRQDGPAKASSSELRQDDPADGNSTAAAAGSEKPGAGKTFFHVPYDMLEVGYADGNISCGVDDILKWHQYLYNEEDDRIVPYAARCCMWTPHVLKTGVKTNYGFGIMTGDFDGEHRTVSDLRELWHTGGSMGFISRISYFPDDRVSAVMLTNWNGIDRDGLFVNIVREFFKHI